MSRKPEQLCETEGCAHAWRFHSDVSPFRCRVTACPCLAFADLPAPEPKQARTEVIAELVRRIDSGQVVVVTTGQDLGDIAIAQLSVLRWLTGAPQPGDRPVAVLVLGE